MTGTDGRMVRDGEQLGRFVRVADGVHVLREPLLRVNVTLVVGDGAALLVDTLSTAGQATALAAAVRAVTDEPLTLVNTHHHFDHCFGNATLAGDPPRPVWAHERAARLVREEPDRLRREAHEEMRATQPELAAELARTELLAPGHTVRTEEVLDVGGRRVVLRHPGPGHTAADLVVQVPDADVLVAGDLVEQGGPPAFEDAYPLRWPDAVAELLRLTTPATVVVPGHGEVVDAEFVRTQHAELAELAWLIRAAHTAGAPPDRVAAEAPFGARPALVAARRGYAELDGTA
ncbi:Glyoxylase, beta-lactamase superfamily II [Micromonospora nigra]|uniref:Glyoxylase, beta-lactamase superfamily II n=1 Tax=Micromonospora nigra TaxID=145857 RepID=A0A1C6RE31_9ACTN|nr:MBL fold metallo-hydrolase [Micromonospora nigra]SCL15412.1 Glyoxylase, beta-lactamase superfamily II [Micromonospora nigra]